MRDKGKEVTFAPALRNKETNKEVEQHGSAALKKKKHVRRHIELTAVLTEVLEQKNKSNRVERFYKNDRESIEYNIKIYDEEFDPGSG